jgi:hypothetical protein
MPANNRVYIALAAFLVVLFFFLWPSNNKSDYDYNPSSKPGVTETEPEENPGRVLPPVGPKNDKWVVVTTINYPTDAIEALASIPGWRVVVVADKYVHTCYIYLSLC